MHKQNSTKENTTFKFDNKKAKPTTQQQNLKHSSKNAKHKPENNNKT